jgi:hypothetical protein
MKCALSPVLNPLLVRDSVPLVGQTFTSFQTHLVKFQHKLRDQDLFTEVPVDQALFWPKVFFLRFLSLNLLQLMRKRKSAQTDLLVRNVTRGATSGKAWSLRKRVPSRHGQFFLFHLSEAS